MSGSALATAVRAWMTRGRIKPATLIRLSGLSRQTIYGILGGGGHPVTPTLMALAAALSSRSLIDLDPDPSIEPRIFRELVEATAAQISGEDDLPRLDMKLVKKSDQADAPDATHAMTELYEFFRNNPDLTDAATDLALFTNGQPLSDEGVQAIIFTYKAVKALEPRGRPDSS